jgi:murein DD-endopeptidase MepM/ murein hydrolase activator NlpD
MKLIFVSDKLGSARTFQITPAAMGGVSGIWVLLTLALIYGAYHLGQTHDEVGLKQSRLELLTQEWQAELKEQQLVVGEVIASTTHQLKSQSVRIAQLQARLLRMEAVGERVAEVAKLDRGEFDFREVPAVGGPQVELGESARVDASDVDGPGLNDPGLDSSGHESGEALSLGARNDTAVSSGELLSELELLKIQLDDRERQLQVLERMLDNHLVTSEGYLAGRPIKKGWMSSPFGKRVDPFHGNIAWHKGVDFAGKENADIIVVASGVVSWSGDRYGYGQMVEVNHGNGYVTRYAHNKDNLVTVGDVVKKGQVIAKMGSSGRSTGPHVHFEVYRNGVAVDPARYIYRSNRT